MTNNLKRVFVISKLREHLITFQRKNQYHEPNKL